MRTYTVAFAVCYLLVPAVAAGAAEPVVLQGRVSIRSESDQTMVAIAVDDLCRDLGWVLGQPGSAEDTDPPDILIRVDLDPSRVEAWVIDTTTRPIRITGSDPLGAVYGIYQFSERFLGVDPYWFWKDQPPAARRQIGMAPQVLSSKPSTFRFRGWFINDEDLLTEWRDGGGRRDIDYPFYHQVVHPEVIERVYESLLRAGGNLVIPASFVDVMNEPEAELVRRAVRRGLYVTQHHIEPLGVSHYGFENYWKARGQQFDFAYGSQPDRVREVWRAFARRWVELAGDRVVWQLGLRGKGDRAIWSSDASVSRAEAGRLISRAISEQWEIVRQFDPRPQPPATATLWLEGSQLMSEGALKFPPGITIVFADEGASQTMQPDFFNTPRSADHTYGVYHHIGFWRRGPHLIQGTRPEKVHRVLSQVVQRGDTHYAILNVCNLREHLLGVQAATEILVDHANWSSEDFMTRFAPAVLHASYRSMLDSLVDLGSDRLLQDGTCTDIAQSVMQSIRDGRRCADDRNLVVKLAAAIEQLDQVIDDYPADSLSADERRLYDIHLLTQARMLRWTYAWLRHLIVACQTRQPAELDRAAESLEQVLLVRRAAEGGKWTNWYRGDKKVDVGRWLEATRRLRDHLAEG